MNYWTREGNDKKARYGYRQDGHARTIDVVLLLFLFREHVNVQHLWRRPRLDYSLLSSLSPKSRPSCQSTTPSTSLACVLRFTLNRHAYPHQRPPLNVRTVSMRPIRLVLWKRALYTVRVFVYYNIGTPTALWNIHGASLHARCHRCRKRDDAVRRMCVICFVCGIRATEGGTTIKPCIQSWMTL